MLNIHSPHFSSSSKIDLVSRLSPCFRNKRIPSAQDNYACHWNRANSCKKLDSPTKISEKNRKRSHNSQQRMKSKVNLSHNIVEELNTLKNEYASIKIAYQEMIQIKIKADEQINKGKNECKKQKDQVERLQKQNDRLRSKVSFLELQIQRIKKQSVKLIQIQQFKSRKLEENLAEKQKAISSLIESFKVDSNQVQFTTNQSSQAKNIQIHEIDQNTAPYLQSLIFSQDKTLSNSQFISISLTSVMENESQTKREITKINSTANQIDGQKVIVTQADSDKNVGNTNMNTDNKENDGKIVDNFKKFRKQITKKIQVNVEQRNKQILQQILHVKSPLERKNSKSNKASKAKLKRDDEPGEHKSSKKKIVHK